MPCTFFTCKKMTRPAQWQTLNKSVIANAIETLIHETGGEWDIVFNCTELATLSHTTGRTPPVWMCGSMHPTKNSVQFLLDMTLSEMLLSETPPEEIIDPFAQVLNDAASGLSEEVVKTLRAYYRPESAHLVAFKRDAISVTVVKPSPLALTLTVDYYVGYVDPIADRVAPRRIIDAGALVYTQCK